jgi:hypothetical protein
VSPERTVSLVGKLPTVNVRVLDPGPIALNAIERFDDPDIDGALREEGVDPANAAFRLLEIPLVALYDVDGSQEPRSGARG